MWDEGVMAMSKGNSERREMSIATPQVPVALIWLVILRANTLPDLYDARGSELQVKHEAQAERILSLGIRLLLLRCIRGEKELRK